jgi:hypothetical protein
MIDAKQNFPFYDCSISSSCCRPDSLGFLGMKMISNVIRLLLRWLGKICMVFRRSGQLNLLPIVAANQQLLESR